MNKHKVLLSLSKLSFQEQEFLETEFISPVVGRSVVGRSSLATVIIGKMIFTVVIGGLPEKFRGYGIFKPVSLDRARFVREATRAEASEYLENLWRVRIVLVRRVGPTWIGVCLNNKRIPPNEAGFPILLPHGSLLPFDIAACRFDGNNLWFERRISGGKVADSLRELMTQEPPPDENTVNIPYMTPEHRMAYKLARENWLYENRDRTEESIQNALSKIGGKLISYSEDGDYFVVHHFVDGTRFSTAVRKDNFSVHTPGFCLHNPRDFDLTTLVEVIRNRSGQHEDDYYDDDY